MSQLVMRKGDTAQGLKKERERQVIEFARRHSTVFPPGELVMDDEPDGRIASVRLGIEVSEVLPERRGGALFTGPQVAVFQQDVVEAAERLYRARYNARPADVLVYFENDWTRKRDTEEMGRALAEFVHSNYPSEGSTVNLGGLGQDALGWVEGLTVVRITGEDRRWKAGASTYVPVVSYEQLAARVVAKNERVSEYRKRLPGWQLWLLLATRFSVLHSVSLPREIRSWQFTSDFDRVLLSSWEDGVLELQAVKADRGSIA